ncbi:hypothetical protein SAMN05421640_3528 [Ekhidna lutea]|uniref:Lipoprotein n=1 Tax=Ekhidna lutea TaxID=447679 RepID=A0A239M1Y4_EKHLU|nr:hypothetical protein [Ekhidna lutea]SNT35929.1 hypothetical protein SAMN05421640_3528 [Ekhidna lutea]
MKSVLLTFLIFLLGALMSCFQGWDKQDEECVQFDLIHRSFDYSELDTYMYDSVGMRNELSGDSARMIDFGLYLDISFHDVYIREVDNLGYCEEVKLLDSIVDVNIYVKSKSVPMDITDSFRNFGSGSRYLDDLVWNNEFLFYDHFLILDLVDYADIPDTAVFVSELVFSTGKLEIQETDSIYFY